METYSHISETERMPLRGALLLYMGPNSTLVTQHDVAPADGSQEWDPSKGPGPLALMPGKLLTREGLESLIRSMSQAPLVREIAPEHILCADATLMAWWRPAQKREIFFNTHDKAFNKDVSGKTVLYPALLFVATTYRLDVFALADSQRPQAKTALYRAPMLNLYAEGNMCSGDTRLPQKPLVQEIGVWERAFFDTRFTHTNLVGKNEITRFRGGHNALWRAQLTAETFPKRSLVPLERTVGEAVNR